MHHYHEKGTAFKKLLQNEWLSQNRAQAKSSTVTPRGF
jgi:hypothetical protein